MTIFKLNFNNQNHLMFYLKNTFLTKRKTKLFNIYLRLQILIREGTTL